MVTYVVYGGYGTMGKVATQDLFETSHGTIIVAGRDKDKAKHYAESFHDKRVAWAQADAADPLSLAKVFHGADVVINCAQYYVNLEVMKACLAAGCHYLDLGGLFHMTVRQLRLHQAFKKKRLLAVLGCGSAPGITNIMAKYGSEMLDKVREIHISFAGYDASSQHDMPFMIPYSASTLFDEFTDKPAVLMKGKLKFVGPMTGQEKEIFPDPIGAVTAFYTLHSELATFPYSFRKKGLKECSFRVVFPDAFVEKIKFLLDIGLGSKKSVIVGSEEVSLRDIVVRELNRFLPKGHTPVKDIEYVRVLLKGTKEKKKVMLVIDCLAKGDSAHGWPAGNVDTGIPPSIIAQMVASKKIRERGVLPPELCIPPKPFFKELKKRNIIVLVEKRGEI